MTTTLLQHAHFTTAALRYGNSHPIVSAHKPEYSAPCRCDQPYWIVKP